MISGATFTPRLDILPIPKRQLWDELVEISTAFVLYGGTALALRLGHRQSVDFDFFGNRDFEPRELTGGLSLLTGATITQQAPNTLSVIVERGGPVRLFFFGLPGLARLRPPGIAPDNGLQIA